MAAHLMAAVLVPMFQRFELMLASLVLYKIVVAGTTRPSASCPSMQVASHGESLVAKPPRNHHALCGRSTEVKELERTTTHTMSARVGGGFLYHTRQASRVFAFWLSPENHVGQ